METTEPKEIRTERIKEHIRRFRHLLEDFSDEIPEEWLSGIGDYKVRMSWWQALVSTLELADMEVISDPILKAKIEAFFNTYSGTGMTHRGTTKENIDEANALITEVIENLQNTIK